jgi:N-acyl-D-amino-acid deacylase
MSKRTTVGLALCLLVAVSACPAVAQTRAAHSLSSDPDMVISGDRLANLDHIDRDMIGFMKEYQIPGASLSIVKNGRLVYARGFGYADVDRKVPVLPTSLFRIASVSKTITSVAILRLLEQGKLGREERIFKLLKLETKVPKGVKIDDRWNQITVNHLLRHEGGWDRNTSGDPIETIGDVLRFNRAAPPATTDHIVKYMLARPLDFDPGTKFAYSNFGYCLLGRVIETITGIAYEKYVRDEILKPMGIDDMRVGRSLLKDRAQNEVIYYHESEPRLVPSVFGPKVGALVPQPYGGYCIEAMDAHGGWIASSVDLARFATALDPASTYRPLSARARSLMFRRPPGVGGYEPNGQAKDMYYAYGLNVRPQIEGVSGNAWHTGVLPGCSSGLLRRWDGVNVAILINKRDDTGPPNLAALYLDDHAHRLVDQVGTWPRGNLFPKFARSPVHSPYPKPRAPTQPKQDRPAETTLAGKSR